MNHLVVAFEITALGMGLVFAAIILLWWMMHLLTRITAGREVTSQEAASLAGSTADRTDELEAEAVAVAVAIALAEQRYSQARALSTFPTTVVSAWQMGMRTRQMYQKGSQIRRPRARQDNR